MLAIVVICASCTREPLSMVFITSNIDVPITLYGERDTSRIHSENDSLLLIPGERTFLCTVEVQDGKFVSVDDPAYSLFRSIDNLLDKSSMQSIIVIATFVSDRRCRATAQTSVVHITAHII